MPEFKKYDNKVIIGVGPFKGQTAYIVHVYGNETFEVRLGDSGYTKVFSKNDLIMFPINSETPKRFIRFTIAPYALDTVARALYSCGVTDFSVTLVDNELEIGYEDRDRTKKKEGNSDAGI